MITPSSTTGQPGTAIPALPVTRSKHPVEIFRVGEYDGEKYTPEFLKKVVENFNRYQKDPSNTRFPSPVAFFADGDLARKIQPTIGIGHEDDQAYLRHLLGRTDLPSAGKPDNLHLDGDRLMASFEGVPLPVAQMMENGQLPTMSAEFYPDYTDEVTGKSYGPMLRRVSLLGGEIPKVKGLRVPPMVFSERKPATVWRGPLGRKRHNSQTIIYFSEGPNMDRAAILAALQACGMDTSTITDAVDDMTLGNLLKLAQQAKGAVATNAEGTAMNAAAGQSDPYPSTGTKRVEINAECPMNTDGIKTNGEMPAPPVNPVVGSQATMNGTVTHAEGDLTDPNAPAMFGGSDEIRGKNQDGQKRAMWAKDPEPPSYHSEKSPADNMKAFSEWATNLSKTQINRVVNPLLQELQLVRGQLKTHHDRELAERRQNERQQIQSFCEQLVRTGKLTPYDMAGTDGNGKPKPTTVDMLLSMDAGQKTITFGEKQVSQRESMMQILSDRPATRTFAERMPADGLYNTSTAATAGAGGGPVFQSKAEHREALSKSETGRRMIAMHDSGKKLIPELK